jgi:hypothetical protein
MGVLAATAAVLSRHPAGPAAAAPDVGGAAEAD